MKFSEVISLETNALSLRLVLNNASVERLAENESDLVITPQLIDIEASLNGEIVSFARLKHLGCLGPVSGLRKFADWSEQELIKPSTEQSEQIRSELATLLKSDSLAARGGKLNKSTMRVETLRILSLLSDEFKRQLKLIIDRNIPQEIDLGGVLPSLSFRNQYGDAIPYFGGPSPWDDEYWLRDDPADICCFYKFAADNDIDIELCVTPKHPVGKIPLDNVFDISIDRASAGIKLSDYHELKSLLLPFITARSLNSLVCPKIDTSIAHIAVASGGEYSSFDQSSSLEEKLSKLVNAFDGDDSDKEALLLAAQNFQMGFNTLHHLWSTPTQISLLDVGGQPSGFMAIKKLLACKFNSSLTSRGSKTFYSTLILVFETQEGGLLITGATSDEDVGGNYMKWDWSESAEAFWNFDLFQDKVHRKVLEDLRSQFIRDGLLAHYQSAN